MLLGPIIGFLIGISLVLFRNRIASFLQEAFEKFPKSDGGITAFDIRFEVRPVFVVALGLVISFFSIIGLLASL
jgi:ABC-type lipoprotein release transport system permease subunit